jgi:hypothetical protein
MEKMLINKSFDAFTKAVKSLHGELSATPERVVKEMFDKLDKEDLKNPNLKILDPAAGFGTFLREAYIRLKEFHTEEHILNNMLYACEINGFKTLFLEKKMGLRNIYKGDFLTMKLPEGWPKEFDNTLSNPPYGNGSNWKLHLDFLEKAFTITKGEIVFVHPSNQFIIPEEAKNSTLKKINSLIEEGLESVTLFNGNFLFGIDKYFPLSITHVSKDKKDNFITVINKVSDKKNTVQSISEINIFGDSRFDSLGKKIKHKVLVSLEEKLKCRRSSSAGTREKDYIISIASQRGHGCSKREDTNKIWKDDFFTFVPKSSSPSYRPSELPTYWFEFDTIQESSNFISYLKTDFARACLSLLKTDNHLNSKMIWVPWMDFTQEWTDKKLYKYFGITKKEQEFIKEIIPPYYD